MSYIAESFWVNIQRYRKEFKTKTNFDEMYQNKWMISKYLTENVWHVTDVLGTGLWHLPTYKISKFYFFHKTEKCEILNTDIHKYSQTKELLKVHLFK